MYFLFMISSMNVKQGVLKQGNIRPKKSIDRRKPFFAQRINTLSIRNSFRCVVTKCNLDLCVDRAGACALHNVLV